MASSTAWVPRETPASPRDSAGPGEFAGRARHREQRDEPLARALGWFSVGLGLAELVAPRRFARSIGVEEEHTGLVRSIGLRELTSGIGILSNDGRSPGWMWSRIGGDAIDLALLGAALGSARKDRAKVLRAAAAVAGVAFVDVLCSGQLATEPLALRTDSGPRMAARTSRTIRMRKAVTINRSPDEIYSFWRHVENLPRVMRHVESVRVIDDTRSHWVARAPAGTSVEWDAEIVAEEPSALLSWRSLSGASVRNSGVVHFDPAPGDRGTEIRVDLEYEPPAGPLGPVVAKLFGEDPGQQIAEDLRRFKQVMETGEVVVSDATISGSHVPERPAQPASAERGARS